MITPDRMVDELAHLLDPAHTLRPEPGKWTPILHVHAKQTCRFCLRSIERTRAAAVKPDSPAQAHYNATLNAWECPICRAEVSRATPALPQVAGPSETPTKGTGDLGAPACATSESALTPRTDEGATA
jgi:hypothetical protein